MGALEILTVTEDSLPAVLHLQSQLTSSSLEKALPVFRRMQGYPNYHVYLACLDGEPVGTFALLIMDNLGHMAAPIAVVENIVVDQAQRRRGIGRKMLEFAAGIGRDNGCYKMILASNLKLHEAHRFYESMGFTCQGYTLSLEL